MKLYSGIDVSKDKIDVALTSDGKKILSTATFNNSLTGFKKLKSWLKKYVKGFENVHFCIESTGIYHEDISAYLHEEGFIVSIINPYQSKSFASSQLLRTKNDKVDANLLAFYAAINEPIETVQIPDEIKKLKKLVRYLNTLIGERAKQKTRLHSVKDNDVADVVVATINFLSESIAQVENKIKEHVKKHSKINHQMALLKSIKGLGDRTAWAILAEIHIEDGKTLNVKAQVAHAGLAPRQFQSGSSINKKPRICKTGSSRLRKTLYMPAMIAIRYNPSLREFYQRLISNGKPKMVALIAVMRKLLVTAIGVLRNNTPFDPDWAKKYQKNYLLSA